MDRRHIARPEAKWQSRPGSVSVAAGRRGHLLRRYGRKFALLRPAYGGQAIRNPQSAMGKMGKIPSLTRGAASGRLDYLLE